MKIKLTPDEKRVYSYGLAIVFIFSVLLWAGMEVEYRRVLKNSVESEGYITDLHIFRDDEKSYLEITIDERIVIYGDLIKYSHLKIDDHIFVTHHNLRIFSLEVIAPGG